MTIVKLLHYKQTEQSFLSQCTDLIDSKPNFWYDLSVGEPLIATYAA